MANTVDPATTYRPGVYGLPGTPDPSLSYRGVVRSLPGLIGYWRLQETSGTSAADDLGAHHGTYEGTYTLGETGPFGGAHKAVFFDGTSGRVDLGWVPTNSSKRSVVAWVRATAALPSRRVYDEQAGTGTIWGMYLGTGPNAVAGGVSGHLNGGIAGNNFSRPAGSAASPLNNGLWHHIAVTVDGVSGAVFTAAQTQLYYDGVRVPTGARSDDAYAGTVRNAPTTATTAKIGCGTPETGNFWQGWISEVSLYTSVLSAAQVLQLYRSRRP
jgi:hypothetical protein